LRGHPIDLLDEVAGWLEEADIEVVYTGGTVVPLHLGELARQELRPTRDVNVVVKSLTYTEYSAIGSRLRAHGFVDCQRAGAPLCRYERGGIEVDVMPIDPCVLGFSNPWYAKGWPHRTAVSLCSNMAAAKRRPAPATRSRGASSGAARDRARRGARDRGGRAGRRRA